MRLRKMRKRTHPTEKFYFNNNLNELMALATSLITKSHLTKEAKVKLLLDVMARPVKYGR